MQYLTDLKQIGRCPLLDSACFRDFDCCNPSLRTPEYSSLAVLAICLQDPGLQILFVRLTYD